MAVGKLIVGSINGSCTEFIINNNIGYCCKAENRELLAEIIKTLNISGLKRISQRAKDIQ